MVSRSRRSPSALVLGGYGAVGRHAAGVLVDAGVGVHIGGRRHAAAEAIAAELGSATPVVVDAASPAAVREAAEDVDVVVNCSGVETVALADAVVAGGSHLVDVAADHQYMSAVATGGPSIAAAGVEALFSVGVAPGLTNLLAARWAESLPDPVELSVVLGAGEEHGRASYDWVYELLGRSFPDTTGRRLRVRNLTGRVRRDLPHVGVCWLYRADFSDQHVLTADLDRPVLTRAGFDSRAVSALLAAVGRVPGSAGLLRTLEPVVPWSRLGSDVWVAAVGSCGRITGWTAGRNQSRATGIVAGLAATRVLTEPVAGVTHLHQRVSLDDLEADLARHGITVTSVTTGRHAERLR